MARKLLGLALAALWLTLIGVVPATADQIAQAQRIADDFAAPRYAQLATATAEQAALWTEECASPDAGTVTRLRAAFTSAVLVWQDIALFRAGPISDDNRLERIAYWPDKRNTIDKRLRELLAASGPVPDMSGKSVAIQGFPALERVLFDDGLAAFDTPAGARRCAVGSAIAGNIAAIARDVDARWQDKAGALRASLATKEGAEEFLRRAATDLLAGYEIIMDDKIREPIGRTPGAAKPMAAELRRSGLSLPAIRRNLESLRALTAVMLAGSGDTLADATAAEAAKVANGAADTALQVEDDPSSRTKLLLLVAAITSARDTAKDVVPETLGVTIGFNSADGD